MANNEKILQGNIAVVQPNYDAETAIMGEMVNELIRYLDEKNLDYIPLRGPMAMRRPWLEMIEKARPSILLFFGHGRANELTGQDDIILMDEIHSGELSEMEVYACADETTRILGKTALDRGCKGYLGYKEKLLIVAEGGIPIRGMTESFIKPAQLMAEGTSAEKAIDESLKEFDIWIDYWDKSYMPGKAEAMASLASGRHSLVIPGKEEKRYGVSQGITAAQGKDRRAGQPRTEAERKERHYGIYATTELPPRGTGLGYDLPERKKAKY